MLSSKYSFRCPICKLEIRDLKDHVLVNDTRIHADCLKCADCGENMKQSRYLMKCISTSSNDEFLIYCSQCSSNLKCVVCNQLLFEGEQQTLVIGRNDFVHYDCLKCKKCEKRLENTDFVRDNNDLNCSDCCSVRVFGAADMITEKDCFQCKKLIEEGEVVLMNDSTLFHADCFFCEHCNKKIEEMDILRVGSQVFCLKCQDAMVDECVQCGKKLKLKDLRIVCRAQSYCPECFVCGFCNRTMSTQLRVYGTEKGKIMCEECERSDDPRGMDNLDVE
ncbi:hypothetical protein ACOME3_002604 [Neoechinorhynchus agilis]